MHTWITKNKQSTDTKYPKGIWEENKSKWSNRTEKLDWLNRCNWDIKNKNRLKREKKNQNLDWFMKQENILSLIGNNEKEGKMEWG